MRNATILAIAYLCGRLTAGKEMTTWKGVCTIVLVSLLSAACAQAELVSVDFENDVASVTFSGVESWAAAANPDFGNANIWNSVLIPWSASGSGGAINPTFPGLLNSAGASTPVSLAFTGEMYSFTGATGNRDDIHREFIYINAGFRDLVISGLTAGNTADFYFYNRGDPNQPLRTFNMLLDTDGNGSLDGTFSVNAQTGAYAPDILVDPSGMIHGRMQQISNQASWSGFQMNVVPEPSTIGILALSLLVGAWRRKR